MRTIRISLSLALGTLCLASACGTIVATDGADAGPQPLPDAGSAADANVCALPELHALGVYSAITDPPTSPDETPRGPITVHVERAATRVLVLSSYDPVDWFVTTAPGVALERVILNGYYQQTAEVPAGVTIEQAPGQFGLGVYPSEWNDEDGESAEFQRAVEELSGMQLSSFHGCYASKGFVLGADLRVEVGCSTGTYEASRYVAAPLCNVNQDTPIQPLNPCRGAIGLGPSRFVFCASGGGGETSDTTCDAAFENCLANIESNPGESIYCEWNGQLLYQQENIPGDCANLPE